MKKNLTTKLDFRNSTREKKNLILNLLFLMPSVYCKNKNFKIN